jgi:hypothetical protein
MPLGPGYDSLTSRQPGNVAEPRLLLEQCSGLPSCAGGVRLDMLCSSAMVGPCKLKTAVPCYDKE